MITLGRHTRIHGGEEEQALEAGMDFRRPEYRREVFLRFYEFHLRYRSHPGCVYYLLPHLAKTQGWDMERKLWFAYLNGNTQNPVTSWFIFRRFPSLHALDLAELKDWFRTEYLRLEFDTDRRYFKTKFIECVENYRRLLRGGSQEEFFRRLSPTDDGETNFRVLWKALGKMYVYFGRLSLFSYLEYLRVMGLEVDCEQLFLDDRSGSRSHRNGLCKVLGRDDLDWHESNPGFDGRYDARTVAWLAEEGRQLLIEARARFKGAPFERDVGYFTMESTFCTYKSWHRPNRRYPNVYNDMLVNRIRAAEARWGEQLDVFWQARAAVLPPHLLLEKTPADPGVVPKKQNHYRLTGEVIMMHRDWPCFRNAFNDEIEARS